MDDNSSSTSSHTGPGAIVHGGGVGNNSGGGSSYALNGKIMLCTVVVLFMAIVLILGIHTYARWLLLYRRRRRRRRNSRLPIHQAARAPQCGLEVSVLESIPTFTLYGTREGPNNLSDCPVCLSEFEAGETGRALPKCGHTFHMECIDMWLRTHSNCPLCRAPVQAMVPLVGMAAVSSPGLGNENGNSSSSTPPVELTGISVEAPQPVMEERFRGLPEDLGSGSGGCDRAKSPGKPVLSMKRIWST